MANNADNQGLDSNLLAWAAARAARWPHLLSSLIDRYLELNNLSEDALCASLHCDLDTLSHLRLCGRPDTDPSGFALDVQRVADKLGLDAGTLASIVREVDTAEAFSRAGQSVSPFSSTQGMLKAARDHDKVSESEEQSDAGVDADGNVKHSAPGGENRPEGPDKGS